MQKDLDLISGNFLDFDLPKSKKFLFKYFTTSLQRQFVRYYMVFGEIKHFVEHTGLSAHQRWLEKMVVKYNCLEEELKKAREEGDIFKISEIESGNYKTK